MNKLIVGVADDEDSVREGIEQVLTREIPGVIIEQFCDTTDLKDFLYNAPYSIDLLLLDVDFKSSESGIQALPKIREYAPGLPITLLTAEDRTQVIKEAYQYKIDYLHKPVSDAQLVIHLNNAIYNKEQYNKIAEEFRTYTEYIDLIEEDNQRLSAHIDYLASSQIPSNFKDLLISVFPDIEFSPVALKELLGNKLDERVFKVLKVIDWKLPPGNGVNVKKFNGLKNENIWEYRISQEGRMFVQYRKNAKPLIQEIYLTRHPKYKASKIIG